MKTQYEKNIDCKNSKSLLEKTYCVGKKRETKESTSADSSGSFSSNLGTKVIKKQIKKIHNLKTHSDIDESTVADSSGSYDVPFGGGTRGRKSPLKIDGVNSILNSRAVKDKNFPKYGGPGGKYVVINDKCKKFPYCNQGDKDILKLLEQNMDKKQTPNIQNIIDNILITEIRKTILNENKNVYHIKCEGELIDTFNTEEEAKSYLNIYSKKHPKKQFLIEKGVYSSYSEMLDKMENLQENKNLKEIKKMKNNKKQVHSIAEAVLDAKEKGFREFKVNGKTYNVNKTWKLISEEEMGKCNECGDKEINETNSFILAADKARDNGKKQFEYPKGSGKMHKVTIKKDIDVNETKDVCNECGSMLNEYGDCSECTTNMNESKKIRLNESQLVHLIKKIVDKTMVSESIPGLEITKRTQKVSGKDSKSHMSDVGKKLKKSLSFEGNDNPEFPKQIGKGEKNAYKNSEKDNEHIEDFRGGGLAELNYDYEPSPKFKERLKKSINGDSTMGNSQDAANVIKSSNGKNILNKIDRKKKKEQKETVASWGTSIKEPIIVKETKKSSLINEEINRMKKIYTYNEKTQ